MLWSTVGGVFFGASIGVAAAGLALAGGTAIYAGAMFAIKGISLASLTVFGLAATKVVAIGLLAHSFFGAVVAPIVGLTVELVGWISDKDKTKVPKPGETPRHPADSKSVLLPNMFSNKRTSLIDLLKQRIGISMWY